MFLSLIHPRKSPPQAHPHPFHLPAPVLGGFGLRRPSDARPQVSSFLRTCLRSRLAHLLQLFPAMELAARPGERGHFGAGVKKSDGAARWSNGRKEQTGFCIVDSQSVKNTDSAENKGYNASKKVSGIKRHIAVDTQGLPHAIHVTTANVTDRAGALATFDQRQADLGQVRKGLVDRGSHW